MHRTRYRIRIRTLMIAVMAAALATMTSQGNDDATMVFAQGAATLLVAAILVDVLSQPGERLRWGRRRRLCRR